MAVFALNSDFSDREDVLPYYTALEYKLDVFLSFDKKLIKSAISQLSVYTPTELLS